MRTVEKQAPMREICAAHGAHGRGNGYCRAAAGVAAAWAFALILMLATIAAFAPSKALADDEVDVNTGTVYISISEDGKFVTSDGEIPAVQMSNVAIDLEEVSKIDLDDYGLGQYKYDADGDGKYDVTLLHLFLYTLDNYYSGKTEQLVVEGAPKSAYMKYGFWGHDENLIYYFDGEYPLYESKEAGVGATCDAIPLHDGDFADVVMFENWDFYQDPNAGFRFFVDANGKATNYYTAKVGEPLEIQISLAGRGENYSTVYNPLVGCNIMYGKTLNSMSADFTVSGSGGKAQLEFDEPGVYYVWADGGKGSLPTTQGSYVSSPTCARIVVGGEAPIIVSDKMPRAAVAQEYSFNFEATGSGTMRYSIVSGTIPSWFMLDPYTGKLRGKATQAGSYTFTLKVENGVGNGAKKEFTLVVGDKWSRLYGDDRYETMQKIVDEGFAEDSANTVIVASGSNFPDALAASSLAGLKKAPILLTDPNSLSNEAASEIGRLGASHAIVVGGEAAVSGKVAAQLSALPGIKDVSRLSGEMRADTAVEIYKSAEGSWGNTAIVSTGQKYADALAISSYAYGNATPIFLTNWQNKLDDASIDAIRSGGFENVLIVGGTDVVNDSVKTQLGRYKFSYLRLSGSTRCETAVKIAEWTTGGMDTAAFQPASKLSLNGTGIATAWNFPDALAGASLCGKNGSAILLVSDDNTSAIDYLAKSRYSTTFGYVFGGSSAVSDATYSYLIEKAG